MSDWKNLMDIDFDTEPHFDKANALERSCKNCTKKRMTLNPMEKCKHEFNLEKDNAGNIVLNWLGNLYETSQFCLDLENGSLTAEVWVDKNPKIRDKFK